MSSPIERKHKYIFGTNLILAAKPFTIVASGTYQVPRSLEMKKGERIRVFRVFPRPIRIQVG